MSAYGEDDFIACLAFVGTVPPPDFRFYIPGKMAHLNERLRYHDAVETFCSNWFKGKPIDGQYAGFLAAFLKWQEDKKHVRETERLCAGQAQGTRDSA